MNGRSTKNHQPNGRNGKASPVGTVVANTGTDDVPLGSCHWIPWEHPVVQTMPDPTRIFSFTCLIIMTGVHYYFNNNDKGGDNNGILATVGGLYLNPYVVFYFGTAVAVARAASQQNKTYRYTTTGTDSTKVYDRWTAEWYWWNAWLFHAVMDGSSGSLRLVPVVVQQYDMLDARFPNRHVVPWIIGMIELLVMYPLCLVTCYCVVTRSPYRFPLELITSSLQFMGMIVFVGSEVYEGQYNIPAWDPVGTIEQGYTWRVTTLYHAVYYWFGFWFCNLIWGVVPYYRIHRAVQECHRAFLRSTARELHTD